MTIKYQTQAEALVAVTKEGLALKCCTPELQHDEDVVMTAIKQIGWAIEYASAELQSNKAFIMKALHESVDPWGLIKYANVTIQSNIEVMTLALEKSIHGLEFAHAKGEAALNKEMAAKALVKWSNKKGSGDYLLLWRNLTPTLQAFFPKDCWYEKAQSYLFQLEQDKQAELVTGGSKEEDGVVW